MCFNLKPISKKVTDINVLPIFGNLYENLPFSTHPNIETYFDFLELSYLFIEIKVYHKVDITMSKTHETVSFKSSNLSQVGNFTKEQSFSEFKPWTWSLHLDWTRKAFILCTSVASALR